MVIISGVPIFRIFSVACSLVLSVSGLNLGPETRTLFMTLNSGLN